MELKHDMFERDSLKMWPQNLKVIATGLDTNSEKKKVNHTIKEAKKALLK